MAMPLHDLRPGERVEMVKTTGAYPPNGAPGTVTAVWPDHAFNPEIVTVRFDGYGVRSLFYHRFKRVGAALDDHAARLLDLFTGGAR